MILYKLGSSETNTMMNTSFQRAPADHWRSTFFTDMKLISCARCGRIHPWGQCPIPKPVYRGGKRTEARRFRSSARWQRKVEQIQQRDMHMCKMCLADGILNMRDLAVHHIVPITQSDELKLEDSNLITLCRRHHDMVEGNEEYSDLLHRLAEIPPGKLLKK